MTDNNKKELEKQIEFLNGKVRWLSQPANLKAIPTRSLMLSLIAISQSLVIIKEELCRLDNK